ncbi:MAG: [acyl-carrier-protein] S-malonyltransferase [Chlorobiaceae bacterium]|nr:[acyl-carrier-protein] S-malonyltransferase [Chlorobiaceae bacterium]
MSKIAYIFPGQGSQYVGMGKDLYEKDESAKAIFKTADKILGIGLSDICFDGPEDLLRQTMNTQPAIFLHSMALLQLIGAKNVTMVAGHSLGEYSALVAAGSITFEDGLKLVRLRGELMQSAGTKNKGTMAAIVGLVPDEVADICAQASATGIVQCANFNSPGQIVISGSIDGVRKAMELSKERGAKIAKELVVSGAFHSPLMQSAREGLMNALQQTNIENAKIPVYTNVTAQPIQSSVEIRKMLSEQLTSAVRWEESISNMVKDGAEKFIEVGPGKVLQGLVRRTSANIDVKGIDKFDDLEKE